MTAIIPAEPQEQTSIIGNFTENRLHKRGLVPELLASTPPMQPAQMAVQAHEFKDKIDDMAKSIEEIKKQLHEQMEFNKKLVERMDQQNMSHIREIDV